jgi:hypothetical protein
MRIDLVRIAARVAAYDFKTKMKINMLAIEEIGRAANVSDLNAVAEAIADSPVHGAIQGLADAIAAEAKKIGQDVGLRDAG